jgi:hypothetical protein
MALGLAVVLFSIALYLMCGLLFPVRDSSTHAVLEPLDFPIRRLMRILMIPPSASTHE